MARIFSTLAVWLLTASAAIAACTGSDLRLSLSPSERATLDASAARADFSEGILFEATRDETRLTILGTVHLSQAPVPPRFLDQLPGADRLFIESTAESEARMSRELATRPALLMMPEGSAGLRAELSAPDWANLTTSLAPYGMPPDRADRIQPWFLALMLAIPICELEAQAAGAESLDRRIEGLAEARGLPVNGLEEAAEVLSIFSSLPLDEQVEQLRLALSTAQAPEDNIATAFATWQDARPMDLWLVNRALVARTLGEAEADAILNDAWTLLVANRNRSWMAALRPTLSAPGNSLIAVGALHLPTEDGLLRLLADEGFTINRLDG